MTRKELMSIDIRNLSDKAGRFFEESDQEALADLFGSCRSLAEIDKKAEAMYDEFFGEEED